MTAALYILSIALFLFLIRFRPWLLMRPSMWVVFAMLVRINGAAAFAGPTVDLELQAAGQLRLATLLFPFLVMIWVMVSPRLSVEAQRIYDRGGRVRDEEGLARSERAALRILGGISLLIMLTYLSVVPVQRSGLAAIRLNPLEAASMREESLKLISFTPLRYAYLWHMEVLAPILIVLVFFGMKGRQGHPAVRWVLVGLLLLSVMITGARGPAGSLLLALGVAYLIRNGVFKGVRMLALTVGAAILLMLVLSIMRDGRIAFVSPELIWKYLSEGIFRRVCVTPYETGVMTNMYAETNGLLGVRNIRPLALLLGQDYVALPNAVGLSYMFAKVSSVSANTSFLFDLQASFGIWPGMLVSVFALGVLDLLPRTLLRLRGLTFVAFYATVLTFLQALVSSAYTTTLVTHGILPTILLGVYWGRRYGASDGRFVEGSRQ